jgi:hypothetical protein
MVGIVSTSVVFTSSKSTTVVAQRHEVAVHQAQRELERMRALSYKQLGLDVTVPPQPSSDPTNPNHRVEAGGMFRAKEGAPPLIEEIVVRGNGAGNNPDGEVDPGPDHFVVGEGTGAITGDIYRYVTWRDEQCPIGVCDGVRNTKRLIVAVKVDPSRSLGPTKPVWVTSVAVDPTETAAGSVQQQPDGPDVAAQNFFLYDRRCEGDDAANGYTKPTTGHDTHDTASEGTSCENSDPLRRPGLMGPTAPVDTSPPLPPYRYSEDLTGGEYPGGLAMVRRGSACPVSFYPVANTESPTEPGKWSIHAWASKKFTTDFNLDGRAFLSFWTTSVGSTPGTGRICVTLVDRLVTGGIPDDIVLGSGTYQFTPWPTTKVEPGKSCGSVSFPCGRERTFGFNLTGTQVRAGARLVLVLSVLGTSDKDLVFLYDDPRYRTFLEVATATPCADTGTPCGLT